MGDLLLTFPLLRKLQLHGYRLTLLADRRWLSAAALLPEDITAFPADAPAWSCLFTGKPDQNLCNRLNSFEKLLIFRRSATAPPLPLLNNLLPDKTVHIPTPEAYRHASDPAVPLWRSYLDQGSALLQLPVANTEVQPFTLRNKNASKPAKRQRVVLVPDTGSKQKCWKTRNWLELAEILSGKGFDPVFVLEPGKSSARTAPWPAYRQEDLGKVAQLMMQSGAVISGDTGPAHLAGLVGVPLLVLYGPTDPELWQPFGNPHWIGPFRSCAPCSLRQAQSCKLECIPCDAEEVYYRFLWMLDQLSPTSPARK